MKRFLAQAGLVLFLASAGEGADRVHAGKGSFPDWRALTLPTEATLAWIVPLPSRLAAIDREGSFWLFEIGAAGLRVVGHYGDVGSPDEPPVAVRLGGGEIGVAFTGGDGRLLLWRDGSLRALDVGAPLSPLTAPVPLDLSGRGTDDLLAVAKDGGLLLIGGLPAAPRVLAHLEVHALPDARLAVGDLDGDGVPEAVVLTDPTARYPHGILGDRIEAGGVTVVEARPFGLAVKGRYAVPVRAVFEDLTPVLTDLDGDGRLEVLLAKSYVDKGAAVAALAWDQGRLVPLAEGPAFGLRHRWTHILGATDLDGDGAPEILTVDTPHIAGVLTAYHRTGATLVAEARAAGFSSHAAGSRNQDQAAVADLNGNGPPEVILPRQSRDSLMGLELAGGQFAERWAYRLRGTIASNLIIADLNGDGLLDLAVADAQGLHVLLSR